MLTFLERKMLKKILFISEGKIRTLLFEYINEEHLIKNFSEEEIKMALSGLEYEGMISMRFAPYSDSNLPIDITPTFEGVRYFPLRKEQFIQFALTSLLVPVAVSILVTFATLWLS